MAYEAYDVVVVPFPFTDRDASTRRPALVLSGLRVFNRPAGHSILAMVTSAKHSRWPLDVEVQDLASAGLPRPSIVRMKLFTLDNRLIIRRAGHLAAPDRAALATSLDSLFE